MRYFLIDRIVAFEPGHRARALKAVSLESDILHDHFPGYPVLPGAFLIEAMAQLSGFLVEMSSNVPDRVRRALLVKVDEAKFHAPAEPGDQLVLDAHLEEGRDDAAKTSVSVVNGDRKVATATLTFVLREVPEPAIHEQRRKIYRIWTRTCQNMPEIL
jgi:3-hydroxyacyl-[acyl-carrier-protein] dehydratase